MEKNVFNRRDFIVKTSNYVVGNEDTVGRSCLNNNNDTYESRVRIEHKV